MRAVSTSDAISRVTMIKRMEGKRRREDVELRNREYMCSMSYGRLWRYFVKPVVREIYQSERQFRDTAI